MDDNNDSDSQDQKEDEVEDENSSNQKDGLADMMSKILSQNVGSRIPILAKRKTTIMKEIQKESQDKVLAKRVKLERKLQGEKQMIQPTMSTTTYEKQLKKLATKGVVALFNAISKAKLEASQKINDEDEDRVKEVSVSRVDVQQLTRDNYLSLLNKTNSNSSKPNTHSKTGSDSLTLTPQEKTDRIVSSQCKERGKGKTLTPSPAAAPTSTWKAVSGDFALNKKPTLKDWDRSLEAEEGEGDGEGPLASLNRI